MADYVITDTQMTALGNAIRAKTGGSASMTLAQMIDAIGGLTMPIPKVTKLSTDTTTALDPNKLYVFPEMSSLTITLNAPSDATIQNEYHFCFDSGSTATVLTVPVAVLQPDGFTVEANMHYEISILEGAMTVQGWAVSAS